MGTPLIGAMAGPAVWKGSHNPRSWGQKLTFRFCEKLVLDVLLSLPFLRAKETTMVPIGTCVQRRNAGSLGFMVPLSDFQDPDLPYIPILGMGSLDHQSYSREGSGFLGIWRGQLEHVRRGYLRKIETKHNQIGNSNKPWSSASWKGHNPILTGLSITIDHHGY